MMQHIRARAHNTRASQIIQWIHSSFIKDQGNVAGARIKNYLSSTRTRPYCAYSTWLMHKCPTSGSYKRSDNENGTQQNGYGDGQGHHAWTSGFKHRRHAWYTTTNIASSEDKETSSSVLGNETETNTDTNTTSEMNDELPLLDESLFEDFDDSKSELELVQEALQDHEVGDEEFDVADYFDVKGYGEAKGKTGGTTNMGFVSEDPQEQEQRKEKDTSTGNEKVKLGRPMTRKEKLERSQKVRRLVYDLGLKIAIVGRPNVGKSTLFNRLSDTRRREGLKAIVHATPGVTRDTYATPAALGDLRFVILDTAGLEKVDAHLRDPADPSSLAYDEHGNWKISNPNLFPKSSVAATGAMTDTEIYRALYQDMADKTKEAVFRSDVVLFMVDAKSGLNPVDTAIGMWLRKIQGGKKVILVANKCDTKESTINFDDMYELGYGEPVGMSASQGLGMLNLYEKLREFEANAKQVWDRTNIEFDESHLDLDQPILSAKTKDAIQVVIIGRPNVGKSTLMNGLLKKYRSIVGPAPGITRDAIQERWTWKDTEFTLVDTAGVRRNAVTGNEIEKLSVESTFNAIKRANIICLVMDAIQPVSHYDLRLAQMAIDEGKGIVLVSNKMDLLSRDELKLWPQRVEGVVVRRFPDVKGLFHVKLSAKHLRDKDIAALSDAIKTTYDHWNKKVKTKVLLKWWTEHLKLHPARGFRKGLRVGKIRFVIQTNNRPPTFLFFGSWFVPGNYRAAIENALRNTFGFGGVPIRIKFRGKKPKEEGSTKKSTSHRAPSNIDIDAILSKEEQGGQEGGDDSEHSEFLKQLDAEDGDDDEVDFPMESRRSH